MTAFVRSEIFRKNFEKTLGIRNIALYNKTIKNREEKEMDTNEIMKMITAEMKKNGATKDQISQMEICIQYLGNEKFREWLSDFVFSATYKK